jgi:uncharacterized protein YebE (UPF0316 family)
MRVLNSGIGTVRLIVVNRGQRLLASLLAFLEALTFAFAIARVVTNLTDLPNLVAYCGGFSVGSYIGMWIEQRFITSYAAVNVITRLNGQALAEALRAVGFGVTVSTGQGRDGEVTILHSIIRGRQVSQFMEVVRATHDQAFVSVEPALSIYRGWLGSVGLRH